MTVEMIPHNPIREALTTGRFCYVIELVPSNRAKVAQLLDEVEQLGRIPGIVAGSVTSYAGGGSGRDPIRVAEDVWARGLTPNVHLTCVNRDIGNVRQALEELQEQGIENVFAITGDYPKTIDPFAPPFYDLDSVQLVEMIAEYRATGWPFYISAAVSPFKYTEAECAYQYLKLEKKIATGADYAITQLGYDSRKFRELKRYLDDRGLRTPVLGSVYVLPAGAARRFSKGDPPGCWASPELVEKVTEEAKAPDKGLAARLERAAKMVAILRGLGYAGAYLGGTHHPEYIRWIIERSEALAPRWEELAQEISYGRKDGYYLYDSPPPPPKTLPFVPRVLDTMARLFPVKHQDTGLRRFLASIMRWVDRHPFAADTLEELELALKKPMFGCKACGNCVLGEMEYVCPMTCPKNMRNGPCGGPFNGQCEVIPDQPCIWVSVYERAQAADRLNDLKVYVPPRKKSLQGTSSFINLFLNRDNRPSHSEPLIKIAPITQNSPALVKK